MPLIEQEIIPPKKEQFTLRLDPELMELVECYARFIHSGQNYVIEQFCATLSVGTATFSSGSPKTGPQGERRRILDNPRSNSREARGLRRIIECKSLVCTIVATAVWTARWFLDRFPEGDGPLKLALAPNFGPRIHRILGSAIIFAIEGLL